MYCKIAFFSIIYIYSLLPGWWNGRHKGLKIPRLLKVVPVRVWFPALISVLSFLAMSSWFISITFINLFSLVMLFILIKSNSVISRFQKCNFMLTCSVVFVICIMEVLTLIFDGTPVHWRFMHIASNFFGFSLTPLVYLTLGNVLLPKFSPNRKFLFFFGGIWILYSLWMLAMILSGSKLGVFYVDELNRYSRGKGFFVYTILYAIGLIYFLVQNIILSLRFWQNNCGILLLNSIFVFIGTAVQIIRPDIQITWLAVIISIIFYFIYHGTLYQQFDSQTYLRNFNSFQKVLEAQKKDAVLIVVEIDNFEKLKLNYSRQKVDSLMILISRIFSRFYRKYGSLFKIGNEEFCVVSKDVELDFDDLNRKFFMEFVKECSEIDEMPLVSVGWSKISPHQDINKVLSLADLKKREFIRERTSYLF